MMRSKILYSLLFALLLSPLMAQVKSVIYVDLSNQGSRKSIIYRVDSVANSIDGQKLFYIANSSNPNIFLLLGVTDGMERVLNTIDPSLPNPYYDLDSLVKSIDEAGGLAPNSQVHFFLSAAQATDGEKHVENLAEKFLLITGLSEAALKNQENYQVHLMTEFASDRKPSYTSKLFNITWYK